MSPHYFEGQHGEEQAQGAEPESEISVRPMMVGALLCLFGVFVVPYAFNVTTLFPQRNWGQDLAIIQEGMVKDQNPRERFYDLTLAEIPAFECKQYAVSEAYAKESMRLASHFPGEWYVGDAIHNGHLVLGRLALRRGDTVRACAELLLAGQAPSSPGLAMSGPNLSLARELLAVGQRSTVLHYLDQCQVFWAEGRLKLKRWRIMIKMHIPPDFGINLYC